VSERECANCKYYFYTTTRNSFNGGEMLDTSECRRYAPRRDSHALAGEKDKRFPRVYPNDWCGEFEPVEVSQNKP
jgi:hypothetical protein